jgi:hypothetical protein
MVDENGLVQQDPNEVQVQPVLVRDHYEVCQQHHPILPPPGFGSPEDVILGGAVGRPRSGPAPRRAAPVPRSGLVGPDRFHQPFSVGVRAVPRHNPH